MLVVEMSVINMSWQPFGLSFCW